MRDMSLSRLTILFLLIASLVAGAVSGGAAFVFAPVWMPYVARHVSVLRPWIERVRPPSRVSAEDRLMDTVARVSRAVVSIRMTKKVVVHPRVAWNPFGDALDGSSAQKQDDVGGGSGFFVSSDGLIVTNRHVVRNKQVEYSVMTQDQKTYPAKIIALDPVLDLALLKVDVHETSFLPFGDSDTLRVGQAVIAIGNTLDAFQNTVTKGIVSGLNRVVVAGSALNSELIESAIQTDAAINPGNSGGPLIDLDGQVVGVNTAVSEDAQSLGFALPINAVKRSVENVRTHGRIIRAWLGVRVLLIDEDIAKENHLALPYGVLLSRGEGARDFAIAPGSPADKAGLMEQDIIFEANGIKLEGATTFSSLFERLTPGDTIHLKILHQGVEKTVDVVLEERPPNE